MRERTKVLVVGGGPAGATAAGLLARRGFEVVVMERERFPRYHIGESLLPSLLPVLDVLGAREAIERHGFVRKTGAFYGWGGQEWALRFDEPGREAPHSFQVVRAEFDQLLLEHARRQGADVREGTRVRRVALREGGAVSASWVAEDGRSTGNGDGRRSEDGSGSSGDIDFSCMVDASGRAGVLGARQLGARKVHDVFRNVAVWGYWSGAALVPEAPEGAIGVFSLPDHGWFWAIPLHDGTLSVGLVTDKRSFNQARGRLGSIDAVYHEALGQCPVLGRMLDGARQVSALKTETDYSYTADAFCGPGYYLAGDAACFLDPLLSTGVHLAMYGGLLSAAAITAVLHGQVDETAARAFYQAAYRNAYERLLILVGAFYRIHEGRDAYFRQAQTLSHRDRHGLRLHESFLNIITGAEDLHDAQAESIELLHTKLRSPLDGRPAQGLGGHATSHMLPLPTAPEHAAAGLYLTLSPYPTLRPVP